MSAEPIPESIPPEFVHVAPNDPAPMLVESRGAVADREARIAELEAELATKDARIADLEARAPHGQVTGLVRRYDAEMFDAEVAAWERETGLPYYDAPEDITPESDAAPEES